MSNSPNMPFEVPLDVRFEDHTAILTLNDPDTRNALSGPAIFKGIESAVQLINANLQIRVAVLTGAGKVFCSGGNIRDMRDRKGMFAGTDVQLESQYRDGIRAPQALYRLEVPLIAAVNGAAIGAGLDLACMCDIRYAAQSATFAESFVKLGIIAGDGGAWFLQRIVGYSNAAQMAFTGDTLNAEEALGIGLVSKVVPDADLLSSAKSLANKIAANPPHVLRWTKRLMREGMAGSLDNSLQLAAAFQALAHGTQDHVEAIAAMFEKRSPEFSGS